MPLARVEALLFGPAGAALLLALGAALGGGEGGDGAASGAPRDAGPAPAARAVDDEALWRELSQHRAAWVRELGESVAVAVVHHDTKHAVFSGCYDWHSAVHGHWALLRAHALTGEPRFRQIVDASLGAEGIRAERELLAGDPEFEMPYGRAWFLRLAIEDARTTGSDRLRAMAGDVAASLRRYYLEREPTPLTPEYKNDAWALRQLFDHYAFTGDAAGQDWVKRTVASRLTAKTPEVTLESDRDQRAEFFSRWGNWAHVLEVTRTQAEFDRWLADHRPAASELEPIDLTYTDHHLGMNFSRAWGLWSVYERTGDVRWRTAAIRHIGAGMSMHDARKGDYRAYGHWVPQFGIYALSATDGRR